MKITRVWRAAAALLSTMVAVGLGFCSLAAALEAGVHADPGSPAGKEYALPLSQARQTGQGGAASTGSSSALFGAGISPTHSRPDSSTLGAGRGGRQSARGAGRHDSSRDAPAGAADGGILAQQGSFRAGSDSTPALLGGGVLVLVLAAFLGVVLRGRRAAHSD